jgi:ubiquinone/menaquinone biosynthesis C-methylase UbiE
MSNETSSSEYVLGTHWEELQRLGFQHRLWSSQAHQLWMRAGISPGKRVLDIGCGPGFASLDLAQVVGTTGQVVGVDESTIYIDFANEQRIGRHLEHATFFEGDAQAVESLLKAQGIEPGSFDIVYMRWVLCFVACPKKVIEAAYAMLKPGGKLCVQDYYRYETMAISPHRDVFDRVFQAIAKSWRDPGGDPDVMGKVPSMAIDAGFQIEHLARVENETPRPTSTMWQWPDTFWPVFLPRLESLGFLSREDHLEFMNAWREASTNTSAFMHLPPVYETIATK